MTTIDYKSLFRNSIGFDKLISILESAMSAEHSNPGFPPYNIEVIEDNRYAITFAVAGFEQHELDIQVEKNVLSVRGQDSTDKKHKYIYQGIAERNFERKFNLADYVEVLGAKLQNGLLRIDLQKTIPDVMKPQKIHINSGHLSEEQLAAVDENTSIDDTAKENKVA